MNLEEIKELIRTEIRDSVREAVSKFVKRSPWEPRIKMGRKNRRSSERSRSDQGRMHGHDR